MKGLVIKTTGSRHQIETPDGNNFDCTIRGKLRTLGIKSTNPLAVGDWVEFIADENEKNGIITDICDRKNYIVRKSVNLSKQTHVLAANIDQAIMVVTVSQPETPVEFIDRFLVTAEAYSIPAILIFNKMDLIDEFLNEKLEWYLSIYESIGYKCIKTSVKNNLHIDQVKSHLQSKISLIAGLSGVGKSSLINRVEPGLNLKISEISNSHQSGKHTTTFSEMFKLSFGGYIIDTPGLRSFGTFNMKKEDVSHYFPEFFKLSPQCQFYNCTHIHEPKCAVVQALENGTLSWTRYKSYLSICEGNDDKYRISE